MTLSTNAHYYMNLRDSLTPMEKSLIDCTFEELYYRAADYGINTARDDRAAELEGALIRFIIESRTPCR